MQLTLKQQEGLKLAVARYKAGEKYTVISGYAGSGKSTLVRFIVDALNIDEDDLVYATFTGKAAQVLSRKGNKNVSTLHKLLYESKPKADGTFIRIPVVEIPYKIVIVDECSMMPMSMAQQLMKYNVHVICLGDPGQLPPINPDEDNHLLDEPHIFLDQIMRQAQESEIIRLSMDIREGKSIQYCDGKDIKVLPYSQLNTGMLTWADEVLVATNNKRIAINNQMRALAGKSGNPQDGDKVICLRNYWDEFSSDGEPLINGTIGYLEDSYETFRRYPRNLYSGTVPIVCGNVSTDLGDTYYDLGMDKNLFVNGQKTLDPKTEYKIRKNKMTAPLPMEFTYGYAITCHKSQGSQWDKVLVLEENFPFDREEHKRWLYTAVTRSAEKCVLVR